MLEQSSDAQTLHESLSCNIYPRQMLLLGYSIEVVCYRCRHAQIDLNRIAVHATLSIQWTIL
jgi:hypothetical protein